MLGRHVKVTVRLQVPSVYPGTSAGGRPGLESESEAWVRCLISTRDKMFEHVSILVMRILSVVPCQAAWLSQAGWKVRGKEACSLLSQES